MALERKGRNLKEFVRVTYLTGSHVIQKTLDIISKYQAVSHYWKYFKKVTVKSLDLNRAFV